MRVGVVVSILSALAPTFGCTGPARGVCEDGVRARCAYEYRCCEDDERVEHAFAFGFVEALGYTNTESECVERGIAFSCVGQDQNDDSIAAGRQELDRADFDECLQAMKDATDKCDIEDFLTASRECSAVDATKPLVDNKDTCALNAECKSGTCDIKFDDDGVPKDYNKDEGFAEGECLDVPGAGDECPDFECATDLFCNADGKCEEFKDNGKSCDFSEECKSSNCDDGKCAAPDDVNLDDKFCTGRD